MSCDLWLFWTIEIQEHTYTHQKGEEEKEKHLFSLKKKKKRFLPKYAMMGGPAFYTVPCFRQLINSNDQTTITIRLHETRAESVKLISIA